MAAVHIGTSDYCKRLRDIVAPAVVHRQVELFPVGNCRGRRVFRIPEKVPEK
jgi:hypothetical protein